MSFTNKTQHYELPQWTGEDKPTFLVDMNNAFAKIDEELYNAGANSDSAQQSAQGANTLAQSVNESLGETNAEVQRINGEVVLLKGTTTTLDNRVQELEGGSGSVSEQLTNLNEKAIINANDIKENQTSIATLQGDMVVAKSDIDKVESQLASGGTKFQFGIDENGNYGYIKAGADTVTPFKVDSDPLIQLGMVSVMCGSGGDCKFNYVFIISDKCKTFKRVTSAGFPNNLFAWDVNGGRTISNAGTIQFYDENGANVGSVTVDNNETKYLVPTNARYASIIIPQWSGSDARNYGTNLIGYES